MAANGNWDQAVHTEYIHIHVTKLRRGKGWRAEIIDAENDIEYPCFVGSKTSVWNKVEKAVNLLRYPHNPGDVIFDRIGDIDGGVLQCRSMCIVLDAPWVGKNDLKFGHWNEW